MPFPNEHSARIESSWGFEKFTRVNDKFGPGIDAIFGISESEVDPITQRSQKKRTLVSIRFQKNKFTFEQAGKWLRDNKYIPKHIESAGRNDEDDSDFDRVARFDVGEVREDGFTRTDEGYIVADAIVSRIGVFMYRNPDGSTRKELRHPDEVLRTDSLATMKLKPVTNGHPPTRLLNTRTAKKYQVGTVGENVRSDAGLIKANVTVTDSQAILAVESKGKKFLSCGYTCDLIREDGVYNGEPYDHRQTNVRYNHVALCNTPRAGKVARINIDHLDSLDAVHEDTEVQPIQPTKKKGRFMAKHRLDGIEYDADQQVINELSRMDSANVDLKTKLDEANEAKEKLQAELDTSKARIDELEKVNLDEKIAEGVKARIALVAAVSPHLDEDTITKLDSMTEKEIKAAVILKRFPETKLDEATESYIDARFDSVIELAKETKTDSNSGSSDAFRRQAAKVNGDGSRQDSTEADQTKARNDMADRVTNAWKGEEAK